MNQLLEITDQNVFPLARTLANEILISQAMFQALVGKIKWTRDLNHHKKLTGKAVVGLPGEESEEVAVSFYAAHDDLSYRLYFTVGEGDDKFCRNCSDPSVAQLATLVFGPEENEKKMATA